MNWMTLIIILTFILAIWQGYKTGFVNSSLNLIIWSGSLLFAFLTYPLVAEGLKHFFPALAVWTSALAFIMSMFFFRLLFSFLAGLLLKQRPLHTKFAKWNSIMGLVPGFINGLIYVYLLIGLLNAFPHEALSPGGGPNVAITDKFRPGVQWFVSKIAPIFNNAIQKAFNARTVEPEKNEVVNLHFHVSNAPVRPDLETEMLGLVNRERKQRGLRALLMDTALTRVGRYHANDMFARGYFSHYTPERKDPFERMRAFGVGFSSAGENLALGQTLTICHEGLMNSPGHRANILNPLFGRVGIGILDGGIYGLMITQEFRN